MAWFSASTTLANRIVILARPTRSYFEWAKFADDSEASYSLLDIRRDCSAWLLPVGENVEKFLREHFDEIFRRELFAITYDEKEFPANRTYEMFRDWFDVEIHSAVYDLDDRPLKNR